MNKNYLIITNSYYYVREKIFELSKEMNKDFFEINFDKILEIEELDSLIAKITTFPFGDNKRLMMIDITEYSNKVLKSILELDITTTQLIMVYYVKDKFDNKSFKSIEALARKNRYVVEKKLKIEEKEVKKILKRSKSKLSPELFVNSDNMDVIVNDINKLNCLENISEAAAYLSPSFEKSVFDLQDALVNKDINKAISTVRLMRNKNVIGINLILLKHFYTLLKIKIGVEDESKIHPYRLKILKSEAGKINNLQHLVDVLLESHINKDTDLEKIIVKMQIG